MVSKIRKRQSFPSRLRRFLLRKIGERFGPRVASVQRLTDEQFRTLFDFDGIADGRDDISGLVEHFAKRVASDWPGIPNVLTDLRIDLSRMTKDEIIERADRALSGVFHPSGVNPRVLDNYRIDWASNSSGSREWLLMMHRHSWWVLWAAAYRETADEKYAEAFVNQVDDWIDQHALPAQMSEHSESWRLMEAGLRMRVSWIPAFGAFYGSPAFRDSSKVKVLRAIYDHGRFLAQFYTNRNHLVRESNGLLALALSFPEFQASTSWAEKALRRLDDELRAQVNEDGSHIEMSVGYQWLTIDEFEVTRALLSDHGRGLPNSDLNDALLRLYEFLAVVIRPDCSFPQLNDGFLLWGADRLERAGRRLARADIVFAASGGAHGERPRWCSKSFPNAGLHVMRSGWGKSARYLVFDTGPYGGPHGHEDMLSFELFGHGAPFIVDPGSYTYEKKDPYREYFVSSAGHNTVLVDRKSQVRRWNRDHMTPVVQNNEHGVWRTSEAVDFASGRYDEGYADFALTKPNDASIDHDASHQRDVLFLKPDYWIVLDYLHGNNLHDYEFLFHLAPDVLVEETHATGACCRSRRNDARLRIQALSSAALSCSEQHGLGDPIQGWYSNDHHQKVPASTLAFCSRQSRSLVVAWLLAPLEPGSPGDSVEAVLRPGAASNEFQIEVRYPAYNDVIDVRHGLERRHQEDGWSPTNISVSRDGQRIWSIDQR